MSALFMAYQHLFSTHSTARSLPDVSFLPTLNFVVVVACLDITFSLYSNSAHDKSNLVKHSPSLLLRRK